MVDFHGITPGNIGLTAVIAANWHGVPDFFRGPETGSKAGAADK